MKIGIMGLAGAGKDTFAEYLLKYMQGYSIEKFAAPLKNAAYQLFGTTFDDRDVKEEIATVCAQDCDNAVDLCLSVLRLPPVADIKQMIYDVFSTDDGENYPESPITTSPRRFQQLLGTEVCRAIDQDCFVKRIDAMHQVIVTDCRFQNEMAAMDEILLVVRPGVQPVASHESEQLAAELTQAYLDCDETRFMFMGRVIHVVDNSGNLDELEQDAKHISRFLLDKN